MQQLPRGLVEALAKPAAYPDDPTAALGVETLQTHLSHLFLTQARVVKLRKAVKLPFLDFSLLGERVADCRREVALNRRLAPDVYLGVAPVEAVGGGFRVRERFEAAPETDECVVVMRRLEAGRDALTLLERGALRGEDLDGVASTLAAFHGRVGLGSPAPWSAEDWWEHCFRPVGATLDSLAHTRPPGVAAQALQALAHATRARFEQLRGALELRRVEGRAVDGHGDVHLQHVWLERGAARPVFIDCVEFDPDLRRIDAASEVAFLAMDLGYRGHRELAERFLRAYASARDDFGLFAVVDAYQGYRAAVRAKVAALAAVDEGIGAEQRDAARTSAQRHLEFAARAIRERAAGALVLVCGSVGAGKSTVAEALAERVGAVVISSDRTRKHLAGLPLDAHPEAEPDAGLYTPEMRQAVYAALLERADAVVASGRVAILDATFERAAQRQRALAWAAQRGAEAFLVEVRCGEDVARERVATRRAGGADASDAGPERVAISRRRFEPPDEWPDERRFTLHTDEPGGERAPAKLVAHLADTA